jgi:ATP-dependent DNA helicase RecG
LASFFDTRIEFLKGIGPQRAALLNKELAIFTYGDLLQHYPFRYEDRSVFYTISDIDTSTDYIQLKGTLNYVETIGEGPRKRLSAWLRDATGDIELVFFKGIKFVEKKLKKGNEYIVYGKPSAYQGAFNIVHPEMEAVGNDQEVIGGLQPVYSSTEKLRANFLDSKGIARIMKPLLEASKLHFLETLPQLYINKHGLVNKNQAMVGIHFPVDSEVLFQAKHRLKYEELFYSQVRILGLKNQRTKEAFGIVCKNTRLLTDFYNHHLPFALTNAQKRVIKEIYADLSSGKQMNRLLQGDVGSGKTIVAFISMLLAIENGTQAALMAPTEILATQHLSGLQPLAERMGLKMALLTGSTKTSERTKIHEALASGELNILVGTHALLEDIVKFQSLGLCVIDEQHKFGVAQRARLWKKNEGGLPPHVLVMTATPIPRTLALTLYGDSDLSIIDELPAGRKPIKTVHRTERYRLPVFGFLREEIAKGRQVYIVYPLIEESEKIDLKNLMEGFEAVERAFPEYKSQISIVHGKMTPENKNFEMERFVKGETKIMVATTVIEVGVNVPNASVMVIENSERFGLAQLHQLRGRVGRGAEQSYCVLMTGIKLSREGRERIATMVRTNNGFEIADTDLKLRGPGNMMGTQQSGVLDLLITDLAQDGELLKLARQDAQEVLAQDPKFELPENLPIRRHLSSINRNTTNWARIS